jgi:hypothetical protein
MSGTYPFLLFCATVGLWFTTVWYSHRLLHAFCRRFPAEAQREIPYAFDRYIRHPEKGIFFFRHRAAEILRADAVLWRQRQRFIVLSVLSVVVPVLGFISICVVAIIETHR